MSHISYFLTGNTAQGHISLLADELKRLAYLFIIEGPYLSDNCQVMQQLYEALQQQDEQMELIHHPSAPHFLQGLLFPRTKLALLNVTPELRLQSVQSVPSVVTLNLYDFYNMDTIKARQGEIDRLTSSIIELHHEAYHGYAEALKIHDDWEKIYIEQTSFQTANAFTDQLVARLFPQDSIGDPQQPIYRFLGAATPIGAVDFVPKLTAGLKRYFIKGRPGSGKSTLLRKLVAKGTELGYPLEIYQCGLDPKSLDMVICRQLGFAIFDSTAPHEYEPTLPEDELIDMYKIAIHPDTDDRFKDELIEVSGRYRAQMKISNAALAEAARLEAERAVLTAEAIDAAQLQHTLELLINGISTMIKQ